MRVPRQLEDVACIELSGAHDGGGADVFAYLSLHSLPVHPTYAMSLGGRLPRDRLRVSSLTLRHGVGMGRVEIEERYYGWRIREIDAMLCPPVAISGVLSMPRAAVSPVLLSALAEAFNGA